MTQAWFEWFPSGWVNFDGISFNAGDSVTITISDAISTSGTATIVNNSNGQRVSQYVTAGGNPPLCQADVEWIMEDYSEVRVSLWFFRMCTDHRTRAAWSSLPTLGQFALRTQ
jgi:hypothetical protein